MRWEKTDMKVAPVSELRKSQMHAPTPNQIPGGQLVTTKGLVDLLPRRIALVFDVLGGPQTLPGAIPAVAAAQPGTFDDQTQQTFGRYLQQVTQGRKDVPLVFYCQGPMCWMSYNAALRAIQLGYKNVLWYRGGLEAWQKAGKPLASAPAPQSMDPGGGGQPPAQRNQW